MLDIKITHKHVTSAFLLAVFIILLPQARLPFADHFTWMDTSILGRMLVLLIFIYFAAKAVFLGKISFPTKRLEITLILLFFVFQSLSVISAFNVSAFLKAYEKLMFGFMVFMVTLSLAIRNRRHFLSKVILVFFLAGLIKLFMEAFLFFAPDLFSKFIGFFLKREASRFIEMNLARDRTYIDFLQETSLPFFLYYFYKLPSNKKLARSVSLFLGGCLGLVSFLSNWRGRFLVFLFLATSSLILLRKYWLRRLTPLVLGAVIALSLFYIADQSQVTTKGFSVVDRLMNKDMAEDIAPIKWRFSVFKESIDMAHISFFGVGLRNFYEWSESDFTTSRLLRGTEHELVDEAVLHGPHNIFFQYLAETGFPGFLVFCLMLAVLAQNDIKAIKSAGELWTERVTIILAFWGSLVAAFFNPPTTLGFYVSFFLYRGLLVSDGRSTS